ncbi:uncharacterized protein LOC103479506 isoform X1 [Poecilia reticulata]|uniref:Uncharacterized LOC103479506 n=1 Tax=Poecilia reticulata TaxID=8081 RepID=A0A3P9MUQ6_POERE|nr:PREDICTED: uncharacterized protein LOC103479506 isoform X1 [Poecilia reticulata]
MYKLPIRRVFMHLKMAQVIFLFHLFLVYALQIQGSSAVTDVFVKTGDDLILNLTEAESPQNSRLWLWQFTGEAMVKFSSDSQPDVLKNYIQRIEVLDKKYSVKLKNLQKSHNGIYTAKVILPTEKILIEYNITVKDPVSPVNLTIIPIPGTTSSCILTLICSADNFSINVTLRCENQTCNLEEREKTEVTKSGSTLHIYEKNASIVCRHVNQVSQIEEKMTQNRCPQPTVFVSETRKQYWYIAFAIALLIAFIVIVTACKNCKKGGDKENIDNTIYAIPVMKNQTETLNETAEDEARSPTTTYSTVGPHLSKECKKTAKDEARSPTTTYSTVGPHLSKDSKKTAKDEARSPTTTYSTVRPSTRGNDQPESVYSQIQKAF